MERKIILSDMKLLIVRDDTDCCDYCGSNQEWFADAWQRQVGCGPSVAANILLYQQRKSQTMPLHYLKKDLLHYMEEAWKYITPEQDGITSTESFLRKVQGYASAHDFDIHYDALDVPPGKAQRPSYDTVIDFIASGLKKETPVAFLNLSNGDELNLECCHWVTIAALHYDSERTIIKAIICDEGMTKEINLGLWLSTTTLGGGFAYFLLKEIGYGVAEMCEERTMKYQNCAKIMKALSSAIRLQIIDLLSHGEMCACAIQEHLKMSQSTISYHMKQLCDCDLVLEQKEGKWTHYRISEKGRSETMELLEAVTASNAVTEKNICCKE